MNEKCLVLNDKPSRFELKIVKLKDLKVGDLFFTPYHIVFVKFSDHIVKNLKNDGSNIMPITGHRVGHHLTMNTESPVYVYKNPDNWFIEKYN